MEVKEKEETGRGEKDNRGKCKVAGSWLSSLSSFRLSLPRTREDPPVLQGGNEPEPISCMETIRYWNLRFTTLTSTIARTSPMRRRPIRIGLGFVRPLLNFDLPSEIRSEPSTCIGLETRRSWDLRSALTSTIAGTCPTMFHRTLVSICLGFLIFGFGFGFGLATEILVVIHLLGMLDV